jgi:hypothetical protein
LIDLFKISPKLLAAKDDESLLTHVVSLTKDPESFLAKVRDLYQHHDETSRDEIELRDGTILDRYSSRVV